MKAIRFARFGGADVLSFDEVDSPRPGRGEVLIDIEAASVTPGDWKLREGHLQKIFPLTLPCIPGRDGAGRIAAVGEGVDYAKPGDAVCFTAERTIQGSYAQNIVRDRASIAPLPAGVSFAEGAALMHAGTCAWIALVNFAKLQPGETIVVHAGAGAIGGMSVQLAKHIGATVIATCSARNVDYVRGLGADRVIAYDREDFAADLRDVDVVLDLIGGEVNARSYPVLKKGGRLVWLIGTPFEDRSAQFGVKTLQAMIHDDPVSLAGVIDLAGRGALIPQVSRLMPLAEAAAAQSIVQGNANSRGRVILDVRGRASEIPVQRNVK